MNVYLEQVGDTFTISPHFCNEGPYPCTSAEMSFTVPAGLKLVSATNATKGSYDPVSNTWRLGTVDAAAEGSRCYSVTLTLELEDDSGLPLTMQGNATSNCVEDASDNVISWVINTLDNVPGGASDVTLDLAEQTTYTLEAGGLIDYVVFTPLSTGQFKIGTTAGGSDVMFLTLTNTAIKTIQLGYYTASEDVLHFSGNGTVDIFLQ